MSGGQLLMAYSVGTAALAVWSYVRWPGAAPANMRGATVRVLIALVLMQVGATVFGFGAEAAPSLGLVLLVGVVVPVLTYSFLASLWFLKVCAELARGGA